MVKIDRPDVRDAAVVLTDGDKVFAAAAEVRTPMSVGAVEMRLRRRRCEVQPARRRYAAPPP